MTNNIYVLSICDDHGFGRNLHRSCHSSRADASSYAENVAKPRLARDYSQSVDPSRLLQEIEEFPLLGDRD